MMRRLVFAIALAAPLAIDGCGKDGPGKIVEPQRDLYPDRSTPTNTLIRLASAFARRDSVVTASVYADDYDGSSIDMTDPNADTLSFNRGDEVRAVGAMALSGGIYFTRMELYSQATWSQFHNVTDPPNWITIQIPHFTIEIRDASGADFTATSESPGDTWIFEFTLKPTPDTSSPTDTTWTIARWVESRAHL
jgi:hypothetical protein